MSVVLPTYNSMPMLAEALLSITTQSFTETEIICVDDGSTDGTMAFLREQRRLDPRIKIVAQPHRGATAAMNRGFESARAPFIARMDADDRSLPHRLATQLEFLTRRPAVGIVGGQRQWVASTGEVESAVWGPTFQPAVAKWRLLFDNILCHPTVLMRRDALQGLVTDGRSGPYNPSALVAQDYELWTRAMFVTDIANVSSVVLHQRRGSFSVSARRRLEQEQVVRSAMRAAHEVLLDSAVRPNLVCALRDAVLRSDILRCEHGGHASDDLVATGTHLATLFTRFTRRYHLGLADKRAAAAHAAVLLARLATAADGRPRLRARVLAEATRISPPVGAWAALLIVRRRNSVTPPCL